ncbi:hypothetical protein DUHN55_34110 [Helicobacter pylori]
MKKLVTLAVAGTFALGMTACGSDNGPEKAVEDFVAAAKDKDYAALCDAFDPEIIKTLEDADPGKDCATIFKENEKDLNIPDDPKVEILGSEIADDEKTATVQVKNEDGKEDEIELKKVDDEWKITTTS